MSTSVLEAARVSASPPGRRERKAAETRHRIFQAAIELFAERGLAQVTVEQITERADVGKGTFFNYFANKEAVLRSFGEHQVERLRDAIDRGDLHGTPRERLRQALQVFAGHPLLTRDLARSLYVTSVGDLHFKEQQGREIREAQEILAAIVREGQRTGDFLPAKDPDEVALFMLGQYFMGMISWFSGFCSHTAQECVDRHVTMAMDGVCTRRAS